MLRRKLLIRIGLLIAGFVGGAVVAIWLLQDALHGFEELRHDSAFLTEAVEDVAFSSVFIEDQLALPPGDARPAHAAAARLEQALREIGAFIAAREPGPEAAAAHQRVVARLPALLGPLSGGAAAAPTDTASLHEATRALGDALRAHIDARQAAMGRYFRGLVLGLTIAALAMVNIAVVVLLHTAQVVLKPVGELVAGSRELALERFDHRVVVDQSDEFGELAHAYNHLAEQLRSNEERKAETLRQLAVTLNHELNNAMAVIELQLGLVDRQAGDNPVLARRLGDIRAGLARMAGTVASLKNIRRVVLTDYTPGQKMLDLERSVQAAPAAIAGAGENRPKPDGECPP